MSWIKLLSVQLMILLGLAGSVELLVSLFYKTPEAYSLEEFIEAVPPPFVNDTDFDLLVKNFNGDCKSPALLHEGGVTRYANDFSCGGVTYIGGKRLTLPKVDSFSKTIHVFGGSTVYGTGSVNENTIPSLLARSLENQRIRVLNYGIASYVSTQQNVLLKTFSDNMKEGDIVVYYDGGNDFWNGVMLGNADGSIVGYNIDNKTDVYIYLVKNWLSKNLKTYQLLSDLRHGRKDEGANTCAVIPEAASANLSGAAQHYASAISDARSYSESLGVSFYHFLQPTLFDVDELNDYETLVLSHNPCWSIARDFKEQYDEEFLAASHQSIDFSENFNNKNVFFDYIHVSAKGNKLIAKDILEEISMR